MSRRAVIVYLAVLLILGGVLAWSIAASGC